ncbi:hypothetical protein SLE2022_288010 [Rubroshorea leprosula]
MSTAYGSYLGDKTSSFNPECGQPCSSSCNTDGIRSRVFVLLHNNGNGRKKNPEIRSPIDLIPGSLLLQGEEKRGNFGALCEEEENR